MKYRKKPVVIEAMQFTNENKDRVYTWASSIQMNIEPSFRDGKPVLLIPTLEGEMIANLGDYIIKGIQGEFYPCKPDIFEQTYEIAINDIIPTVKVALDYDEIYQAVLKTNEKASRRRGAINA